jgi:hypothetical protein
MLGLERGLNGHDIASLVEPTPIGWSCIRLRENEIPPQWLRDNNSPNLRRELPAPLG